MKKVKIHLEFEKNEKLFVLQCDPESSIGTIFDVLSDMQAYVLQLMKEHALNRGEDTPKEVEGKEEKQTTEGE